MTLFFYMNLLNSNIKPIFLFLLSFVILSIVGVIDYFTGPEISPLLLYLVPIFFIGLHSNTSKKIIFFVVFLAALFWIIAEYNSKEYSSIIILYWNAFVRFIIFLLFGMLLFQLRLRYNKLLEVNTKLEQLNLEKNKIIGVAAHDLKNPIGSIQSFTTLLLEDYKDELTEEVEEILGYIKELSSNSFHILCSLLDVSKIESGIIEIVKINQDYISFINKLISVNQLVANKKNIKINFNSEITSLNFEFDQNHLSQVVNNLLTNAIKFSYPNKEINILVTVTENNILRTLVEDNGKGIAESDYNKLFNYFQKTGTTPTDGETSTGLGLAISKKIIQQHGGTIGFVSKLNVGSKFYFELNLI